MDVPGRMGELTGGGTSSSNNVRFRTDSHRCSRRSRTVFEGRSNRSAIVSFRSTAVGRDDVSEEVDREDPLDVEGGLSFFFQKYLSATAEHYCIPQYMISLRLKVQPLNVSLSTEEFHSLQDNNSPIRNFSPPSDESACAQTTGCPSIRILGFNAISFISRTYL